MKKIVFSFIAIAAAAAAMSTAFTSCNKMMDDHTSVATEEYVPEGSSRVTINFFEPAVTKAGTAATTAEKNINSLAVYVFDKNNKLEAVMTPSIAGDKQSATATVTITNGQKYFRAVANGEAFSTTIGTTTVSDFDNKLSVLGTNTTSSFVMTASGSKKILTDDTINMTLNRLCSKVCLVRITRSFADADLAELNLKITGVWINNVAGDITWGASAVAAASVSNWYNKGTYTIASQHSDLSTLLYHDIADYTLAQSASNTTESTFYVYSNSSTATTMAGTWSQRVSRMVVECELAGMAEKKYYIAQLPQTDPNKVYNVDLTLTGLPCDNPDDPTSTTALELGVTATITVSDWGAAVDVPVTI